ncbi:MAG: DNA polymerase IV [Dehalococcoidia bacterium]|nr:DNA polymerase IV [Dehalococcoidia bacterium]
MRHIIHADLDAFYAAVEQLDNPDLAGKPVLVGGRPENRGVVATASYEARVFGVHSAMPMKTAVYRCPKGIIVSPRFGRYKEKSGEVMTIFRDLTDLVEPLSMDEAYLDITAVVEAGQKPLAIALDLKARVFEETGLVVSVGVGTCKTVAKIGSDLDKPDGLVVVQPGDETEFLAPLAVNKLWGIGPKTAERLNKEGIETIGDLADQPLAWFAKMFGKRANNVRDKAKGMDDDAVQIHSATKSISSETTFTNDVGGEEELRDVVERKAVGVAHQLERNNLKGRTVKLKLRLSDFTTFTRQVTLPYHTDAEEPIKEAAWGLLEAELEPGRTFRLIGVGMANFEDESEEELPSEETERQLPLFTDDGLPIEITEES